MTPTKLEHFVPQSYLANFACDGQLWVFDKETCRIYRTHTANVALESGFYDAMPARCGDTSQKRRLETKLAAAYDAKLPGVINRLLEDMRVAGAITNETKKEMLPFLALQILRTRRFRDAYPYIVAQMPDMVKNDGVARGLRVPSVLDTVFSQTDLARLSAQDQAWLLEDKQTLEMWSTVCDRLIWVVGVNSTPQPLYASDCPVNVHSYARDLATAVNDHLSAGLSTIAYPLSPSIALLLLNPERYPGMQCHEQREIELGRPQVNWLNAGQVMWSGRQVFCSTDQLEFAIRVCCILAIAARAAGKAGDSKP